MPDQQEDSSEEQPDLRPPAMTILGDGAIMEHIDGPPDGSHFDQDAFRLHSRLAAAFDILRHEKTDTPTAIAIYGRWGTGKTSGMRWLQNRLQCWNEQDDREGHPKVRTVWFNPWKYHTREDVWRGLIAEVILRSMEVGSGDDATPAEKVTEAAKKFGGFLGRSFLHGLASTSIKAGPAQMDLSAFRDIYEEYEQAQNPEAGYLNEFEETLRTWLDEWLGQDERLAVFIDDLDRCLPDVTLEVLEALKLYLNFQQLVFVVGLDRSVVDRVIRRHYVEKLASDAETERAERIRQQARDKADRYLDKMFQVEINIAPGEQQVEDYFDKQVRELDRRTGGYWEKLEPGHKDALQEVMSWLARQNPREVKRLLNGTLMAGVAAGRRFGDQDDKQDAPLFAQGVQVFLLKRIFRVNELGPVEGRAEPGWVTTADGSSFLSEFSELVRDVGPEAVLERPARDRGAESPEAAVDMEEGPRRDPGTKPDAEQSRVEEFLDRWSSGIGSLARELSKERNVVWLLQVPFDEDVAQFAASVRTEEEGAGARQPEPSLEDMPAVILRAAARSLDKSVDSLRADDLQVVRKLDLSGTQVSDLSPLEGLTNLEGLDLEGTQVSELGPLEGLTNLQWLALNGTQVSVLGPLEGLTNLQGLGLSGTPVSDLGPLEGLTNLQGLVLNGTQASELGPLEGLTNLQWLGLSGTQVSELGPLKELTNLRELDVRGTSCSDFAPLQNLKNLFSLSLAETAFYESSLLRDLKNLRKLDLGATNVSELGPLGELTDLQRLDLAETSVSETTPLRKLTNLKMLSVENTEVADLKSLRGLTNLRRLYLAETKVKEIHPLESLTNLQVLDLRETQVESLGPLLELPNLHSVYVDDPEKFPLEHKEALPLVTR